MVLYKSSNTILENPISNFDYGSLGVKGWAGFDDFTRFNTKTLLYTGTDDTGKTYWLYDDDMKADCYMRESLYRK